MSAARPLPRLFTTSAEDRDWKWNLRPSRAIGGGRFLDDEDELVILESAECLHVYGNSHTQGSYCANCGTKRA